MKETESLFERVIFRAKNNRVAVCFLVLGTAVIALASFTDAAKRIFEAVSGRSPQEARIELGKMSLEYTPDVFVRSAQRNDLAAVKLFLAAGMDVNAKDGRGDPALASVAGKGNAAMVRTLLDAKANVMERDSNGRTALFKAAYSGRIDVLQLLLKYDADVHSRNEALEGAAAFGQMESLLILKDAVLDRQAWTNALLWAVHSGGSSDEKLREGVKFLLDHGADPNAGDDEDKYTALMWAIQWTRLDIAHDLMKYGADVNDKGTDGKTALMLAIAGGGRGNEDLIRDLLEHGARLNEKDVYGNTVVSLASTELKGNHRTAVLRLLRGSAGH